MSVCGWCAVMDWYSLLTLFREFRLQSHRDPDNEVITEDE